MFQCNWNWIFFPPDNFQNADGVWKSEIEREFFYVLFQALFDEDGEIVSVSTPLVSTYIGLLPIVIQKTHELFISDGKLETVFSIISNLYIYLSHEAK